MCPRLGTQPATQACALTENQTRDPLIHRPTLNPLSHTSQGYITVLILSSIDYAILEYCVIKIYMNWHGITEEEQDILPERVSEGSIKGAHEWVNRKDRFLLTERIWRSRSVDARRITTQFNCRVGRKWKWKKISIRRSVDTLIHKWNKIFRPPNSYLLTKMFCCQLKKSFECPVCHILCYKEGKEKYLMLKKASIKSINFFILS